MCLHISHVIQFPSHAIRTTKATLSPHPVAQAVPMPCRAGLRTWVLAPCRCAVTGFRAMQKPGKLQSSLDIQAVEVWFVFPNISNMSLQKQQCNAFLIFLPHLPVTKKAAQALRMFRQQGQACVGVVQRSLPVASVWHRKILGILGPSTVKQCEAYETIHQLGGQKWNVAHVGT